MKKSKELFNFDFEIVMVKDPNLGGFTGHLVQFPSIITEVETEEETIKNIMDAFHDVMVSKGKEASRKMNSQSLDNVIRRSVSFQSSNEFA